MLFLVEIIFSESVFCHEPSVVKALSFVADDAHIVVISTYYAVLHLCSGQVILLRKVWLRRLCLKKVSRGAVCSVTSRREFTSYCAILPIFNCDLQPLDWWNSLQL